MVGTGGEGGTGLDGLGDKRNGGEGGEDETGLDGAGEVRLVNVEVEAEPKPATETTPPPRRTTPLPRLRVVTCASAMTPSLERLRTSVERGLGVPLEVLCLDEPWLGHGSKLSGLRAWLATEGGQGGEEERFGAGNQEVVLFLDAYDILVGSCDHELRSPTHDASHNQRSTHPSQ